MFEIGPAIGILLILGSVHSQSPPPAKVEPRPLYANVDQLSGRFDPQNIDYGYSTWATIGYIDEVSENRDRSHVVVDLFPVEYCQVARICITETKSFDSQVKYDIVENLCDDHIEYYPPSGKFVAKIGADTTTGYIAGLKLTASTGDRVLQYSEQPFYRTKSFKPTKQLRIVLSHKMFLMLTNSRQCHSRVVVDGKVSSLEMLPTGKVKDTSLPEQFNYVDINQKTKTIYTSDDAPHKRTHDWLPQLKTLTTTASQIGQRKYQCFLPGLSSPKTVVIAKTSVMQAVKTNSKTTASLPTNQLDKVISISVTSCHWVRLWFTSTNEWSQYKTMYKPEDSIDLFLHEGFAILPDRNNAVRIPLSGSAIDTIMLRAHGDDIVELLLGPPAAPYPIVFKSEILKNADVNIFMIRSPRCDASFQNNGMTRLTAQGRSNKFAIGKCKAYHIEA